MADPKILFSKEYCSESLVDVERDIYEALEEDHGIPVDQHGFQSGTFTITITHSED